MILQRQKTTTTTATTTTTTPVSTSDVPASSPTRQDMQDTDRLEGTIATRAYALYEERGYRHGCDLQDWLDAEREILSRKPSSQA